MTPATAPLRLHGDTLAAEGALDFAVNVWPGPRPPGLERALADALARAGRYPDTRRARAAVAERHGREPREVLLTNGAAEALWLLATALRPGRAACVHPGFTEPEAALRAAGGDVVRVFREPDSWRLDPGRVPRDADLVVVGNPDNPTGALEPAGVLVALARPGRVLVVDESFMDFVPREAESLAGARDVPGLAVVRSLTKLWGLAGIRAGYLVGPAGLVRRLEAARQPWSVNALACAALAFCAGDAETPARVAAEVASTRAWLEEALAKLPAVAHVWPGAANFLLAELRDGPATVAGLAARGIAIRPAGSFPGLGPDHVRIAVRPAADCARLVAALREFRA
jgi:histidinol-phosphate/aromatic aminotransferase/cobyric acid decarboxylase-like protein